MVRAPCCEKTGLKKGPWTTEEDRILTNFIILNGFDNWRALPKRAGLLRCGKSCRLRWMNYLRPDIKRGDFTQAEEERIIELHQQLGNKWSAIAASLPGRTDNEIKNVWHTHLKKRVVAGKYQPTPEVVAGKVECTSDFDRKVEMCSELSSPEYSLSEVSSVASAGAGIEANENVMAEFLEEWPDSFWSEVFPAEEWSGSSDFSSGNSDDGDFWRDVFNRAEELNEFI